MSEIVKTEVKMSAQEKQKIYIRNYMVQYRIKNPSTEEYKLADCVRAKKNYEKNKEDRKEKARARYHAKKDKEKINKTPSIFIKFDSIISL
jgi:hypothetical protein